MVRFSLVDAVNGIEIMEISSLYHNIMHEEWLIAELIRDFLKQCPKIHYSYRVPNSYIKPQQTQQPKNKKPD